MRTSHFAPNPQKLSNSSSLGATSVLSVTALAGVPAFVREVYGERVLRRANEAALIDIEAIEDQDCFIPHITMTTFGDTVSRLSGEEHFGLAVAPHLSITSYGCWGDYILGAATLGAAFERAAATVGFHSKGDTFAIAKDRERARISYNSAARGQDGYQHVACGAAGAVLSICKAFLPATWRAMRIELDMPKPPRADVFEETFRCPVIFDRPAVSVWLETNRLDDGPSRFAPRSLVTPEDLARARVAAPNLTGLRDVVTEQVWSQVLAGHVSIDSAARSIDTSVRTLQRELNREGTDFRSITNAMRTRRGLELLRGSDMSVTRISGILGYSDSGHFARAFRKATGISPVEFRQCSDAPISS